MSEQAKTPWTPGPWICRYDGEHWNDKDSFYVVANPSGSIGGQRDIALVLGDYTQGKTEANARLMAKAPELYDALLNSHQLLVMLSDQVSKEQRSAIYDQCAWNSTALAKARGDL